MVENDRFDVKKKRRIRVLSLFDGIGTGLVALKHCNLIIDSYFACEIDPKAIDVTTYNHGYDIMQYGDVTQLTNEKLDAILPIHLLLGGSPCNELSLANPTRKGIYSNITELVYN